MPIIEAGFVREDGFPNPEMLLTYGPTARVLIGHYRAPDDISPKDEDYTAHALIDTGATESHIDKKLAQELELPAVDVRKIAGADGESEHEVYLAQIHIPDINFIQYGRFAGADLSGGGQQHQAILGRTFLKNTIMIYDGVRSIITVAR